MSIIESIRDFIATCPFIEELDTMFPPVNVDKLEPEPSYSIESVPSDPIIKRCINGDSIRRVTFYLCSRNLYGAEENLDTSQFYENFADWLEDCTRTKCLPALGDGQTARAIKANTHGYINDSEATYAQYQIQCELQYYQKRKVG